MSNSRLVSYVDTTTQFKSPRTEKIDRITVHHAAGDASLETMSYLIHSAGRDASWNYAIDSKGKIGLFVTEDYRSWCSSSSSNDNRAITIEVCNNVNSGPYWTVSDAAYASLLNLCEDICRRNGISKLTYTGSLSGSNLTRHDWFYDKICPGPYLGEKFPDICKQVNDRLKKPSTLPYVFTDIKYVTAEDNFVFGTTVIPPDFLMENIDPYILTVDRDMKTLDFDELKEKNVLGVILEAGYLYDKSHVEQKIYRNPNVDEQVKMFYENNFPFGFYATVRAKNNLEAKRELYQLSFIIRNYPPSLGLWLDLDLTTSYTTNNEIIDTYYDELVRWGLKGQMGFYIDRKMLDKIDWKKHQENWYLWIVDHIDDLKYLDEMLTPQFFMTDASSSSGSSGSSGGGINDPIRSALTSSQLE